MPRQDQNRTEGESALASGAASYHLAINFMERAGRSSGSLRQSCCSRTYQRRREPTVRDGSPPFQLDPENELSSRIAAGSSRMLRDAMPANERRVAARAGGSGFSKLTPITVSSTRRIA